jgi:hypothetical protein
MLDIVFVMVYYSNCSKELLRNMNKPNMINRLGLRVTYG